jgi:NAD(P)H-dependent FMN reductase
MKILILTQSSKDGLNYKLSSGFETFIQYEILNRVGDITIANASDDISNLNEFTHIIMVVPEWNGSFPFMFKQLIDNSGYPSTLKGANILLIGTSNTSFGNILGITQLDTILEWIGAEVFNKKICVPFISQNVTKFSGLQDTEHLERLNSSIRKFLK